MRQLRAIQALRWNYRWRGVWIWLRRRIAIVGGGQKEIHRGWWWVLRYPTRVRDWQTAIAEGVIF